MEKTYVRIKNGLIYSSSKQVFKKNKKYNIVETESSVDEFSYYEQGEIKRRAKEEIDELLEIREFNTKLSQKERILSYIDATYLLQEGTATQITKYREILSDFQDIGIVTQEEFDAIEYKVLKFELSKTETLSKTQALSGNETLEELKQLYNDIFS